MRNIFLIYTIALFPFLFSCNSNEPDGGPCTYKTKVWMATVIKIDKVDSLQNDVIFNMKNESGELVQDSVSWFLENKTWLTNVQLEKDSVMIGEDFKYYIDEIISGACNPRIERLTLEKY